MSVALQDQQFEIDGVTFGGFLDGVKLDSMSPGSAGWDTQDVDNPFGPVTYFGKDTLRGPEWSFEMVTDGGVAGGFSEARDATERLAAVWRDPDLHDENRLQVMRYRLGGRTRRVYGRGRKFDPDLNPFSFSGTSPIDATFKLAENVYYDDDGSQVDIPIVKPTSWGIQAPITMPIAFQGPTNFASSTARIGGTVATPVDILFRGPIIGPWVSGNGFYVKYDYELAYDQTLLVQGINKLTAYDNFGRNLTPKMNASTRLANVRIKPGVHSFTFGGSDVTGTARAILSWRNAYTTM